MRPVRERSCARVAERAQRDEALLAQGPGGGSGLSGYGPVPRSLSERSETNRGRALRLVAPLLAQGPGVETAYPGHRPVPRSLSERSETKRGCPSSRRCAPRSGTGGGNGLSGAPSCAPVAERAQRDEAWVPFVSSLRSSLRDRAQRPVQEAGLSSAGTTKGGAGGPDPPFGGAQRDAMPRMGGWWNVSEKTRDDAPSRSR
jgi:hypothetical protein